MPLIGVSCTLSAARSAGFRAGVRIGDGVADERKAVRFPEASPSAARPWLRWYGTVPAKPFLSGYDPLRGGGGIRQGGARGDCLGFHDTARPTRTFLREIAACANGLAALGLGQGERILVAMPTTPQGIIAFLRGQQAWRRARHGASTLDATRA